MSVIPVAGAAETMLAGRRVAAWRAYPLLDGIRSTGWRFGRRPGLVAIVLGTVAFLAISVVGSSAGKSIASGAGADGLEDAASQLGVDVLGTVVVIVLITLLGWRRAGFGPPSEWSDLRLLLPPLVILVPPLADGIANANLHGAGEIALSVPQPLLTGFWEEGLLRGFFLYLVLVATMRAGRSPLSAVLISSVVFAVLHLAGLTGGHGAAQVLSQVPFAFLGGIGFAALLLRTNALWLIVLFHAVFNVGSAVQTSDSGGGFSIGSIVLALPFAIYGLFLLRHVEVTQPASVGRPAEPAPPLGRP